MLQKLHQKLGTAGFVISIIALVAALGGGAYAASGGLNPKQKKEVKKIAQTEAKKLATAGPQGPAGAPGAKGDAGAAGATGSNGTDGTDGTGASGESFTGNKTVGSVTCTEGGVVVKSAGADTAVCNGKKGAQGPQGPSGFGEVLAGEKTITGVFSYTQTSSEEALFVRVPISFPIPLAERLDGNHVHIINPAGEEFNIHPKFGGEEDPLPPKTIPNSTDCLGSPEEPSAEPGHLCVYVVAEEKVSVGVGPWHTNPVVNPAFSPEIELQEGTAKTGAMLVLRPAGEAGAFTQGTWALTAPAD